MSDARKKKQKALGAAVGVSAGVVVAVGLTLALALGAGQDSASFAPEHVYPDAVADDALTEPHAP